MGSDSTIAWTDHTYNPHIGSDQRPYARTSGGAPLPRDLDVERPLVRAVDILDELETGKPKFNLDARRLMKGTVDGGVDLVVDAKAAVRQWTFDEMIREVEAMRKHLPKVEKDMSGDSVMAVVEAALPFMLNNWARAGTDALAAQDEPPAPSEPPSSADQF